MKDAIKASFEGVDTNNVKFIEHSLVNIENKDCELQDETIERKHEVLGVNLKLKSGDIIIIKRNTNK